jgi:hypothetical protein
MSVGSQKDGVMKLDKATRLIHKGTTNIQEKQ